MPVFQGKQIKFTLTSLPTHASKWVGKIVYCTSASKIYYANATQWVEIGDSEVSLDDAYNNGRQITVDSGAVELDATPGANSYAPLRLVNLAAAPSSNLLDGDVAVVQGRMWVYDSTRTKWLSTQRDKPIFGKRSADGTYLIVADNFITRNVGFICHYNSTIVGLTAKCDAGNLTKTIRVRRNGLLANLFSFSLVAGFYSNLNLNVGLNQNDILQVFATSGGIPSRNLSVQIELAYNL